MTRINKDQLRKHASKQIDRILKALNINFVRRGDLLQSTCPCKGHPGDATNPTAFSWRDNLAHWVCWTHHCEQETGSDILGLVWAILDVSFNDCLKWLEKFLTSERIDLSSEVVSDDIQTTNESKTNEPISENCLRFLEPNFESVKDRNYSPETFKYFEAGLWSRLGTFMHNRLVFPIRDSNCKLIGFTGRTIYPQSEWSKYQIKQKWVHGKHYDRWPQPNEFKTGAVLYNLCNAKKHLSTNRNLILVEGPFDGLRLHEAGISNWAAILGCNFTSYHRSLLISLGINTITLALDIDKAGKNASAKIADELKDFFHIQVPDLQNDPGKSSIEDLKRVFNDN